MSIDKQRTAIEQDINRITLELLRLAQLPYTSVYYMDQIVTLANQKDYLEDYLAKLEEQHKNLS